MPATTTTALSSNWKKLQVQLQSTKKSSDSPTTNTDSNGTKRKRPIDKSSTVTAKPISRPGKASLTSTNTTSLPKKKRKMGSYVSTAAEQPSARPISSLTTDHDIPAADLTAAYGSSNPRTTAASANTTFQDEINGGLHPTHRAGKFLALDCEMVGTGPPPHTDDLLARVSLVNFHGEQIYDSYVLPPSKQDRVQDYRTHVSGITPWHLRPTYARPFAEVQRQVSDLLNDKILVGHALKKDLEALQLTHPKRDIRDTSRYAPFRIESRGKPPALRNLAKSELGLIIQTGEHSSVEDARATMGLFRKEKQGFEEDNRKVFGTKRRVLVPKGKQREESVETEDGDENQSDDEDDEDLDDEDLDLLEGEEDAFAQAGIETGAGKKKAAPDKKKKSKKKKSRTKRK